MSKTLLHSLGDVELAEPKIITAERIYFGKIAGKDAMIEREFDGVCVAWIENDWYELTATEYDEIRKLIMKEV